MKQQIQATPLTPHRLGIELHRLPQLRRSIALPFSVCLLAALVCGLSAPAAADSAQGATPEICSTRAPYPTRNAPGVEPPAPAVRPNASRATGGWNGVRETWQDKGVEIVAFYTADFSAVASGLARGSTASRGLLQIGAAFDLERLTGWSGATIFAGLHGFRGANGSETIGDIQGYSNIDAERFERAAEIWFEQRLASDRFRMKLGRVDANTEFAFVQAADQFVNSSAGFSPTVLFMPTYPNPAPSINLFYESRSRVRVGLGVYGRPDDSGLGGGGSARFTIGELNLFGRGAGRLGPRRGMIGVWHDTGGLERFDGGQAGESSGFYAVFEQQIRMGATGPAVDFFLQLGRANENHGEFGGHLGVGATAASPIPRRGADSIGGMVSVVDLSDAPEAGFARNETTVELFYAVSVTPYLRIKPDLQYVAHAAGGPDSALVGTLRVEVAF